MSSGRTGPPEHSFHLSRESAVVHADEIDRFGTNEKPLSSFRTREVLFTILHHASPRMTHCYRAKIAPSFAIVKAFVGTMLRD